MLTRTFGQHVCACAYVRACVRVLVRARVVIYVGACGSVGVQACVCEWCDMQCRVCCVCCAQSGAGRRQVGQGTRLSSMASFSIKPELRFVGRSRRCTEIVSDFPPFFFFLSSDMVVSMSRSRKREEEEEEGVCPLQN